jgi:predicted enzyme related to lactoylglutathione lyase
MTVSISGVHVLADDPDAAIACYRDTLGLTVRSDVVREGFRWITLTTDSQAEVQIVLSQPHAGRSQEDGDALAEFSTGDLDALFEKGAEVLQEPVTQPWGTRDPAGNHVRLEQAG